jgi:hypothetical protein
MIADYALRFPLRQLSKCTEEVVTWRHRHFVLHVATPILIGAAIYTCWRSTTLLVFAWYKWLHLYGLVATIRHAVWPVRHFLPGWILFSLPDGCWVYAFTALLAGAWKNSSYAGWTTFWCLLPAVLAVGAEGGQAFHLVPGTFDVADLMVYLIAGTLATYFSRRTE